MFEWVKVWLGFKSKKTNLDEFSFFSSTTLNAYEQIHEKETIDDAQITIPMKEQELQWLEEWQQWLQERETYSRDQWMRDLPDLFHVSLKAMNLEFFHFSRWAVESFDKLTMKHQWSVEFHELAQRWINILFIKGCKYGQIPWVKWILSDDRSIKAQKDVQNGHAINVASHRNQLEMVNFLLPFLPLQKNQGKALCEASKMGHIDVVKKLLDQSWYRQDRNDEALNECKNALSWACQKGQMNIVKILMDHGSLKSFLRTQYRVNEQLPVFIFWACLKNKTDVFHFLWEECELQTWEGLDKMILKHSSLKSFFSRYLSEQQKTNPISVQWHLLSDQEIVEMKKKKNESLNNQS